MQSDIDYACCSFYTSLLPIIELVKHASFFKGYIFCFPENVFISLRHGGSSLMTSHTASLTPPLFAIVDTSRLSIQSFLLRRPQPPARILEHSLQPKRKRYSCHYSDLHLISCSSHKRLRKRQGFLKKKDLYSRSIPCNKGLYKVRKRKGRASDRRPIPTTL